MILEKWWNLQFLRNQERGHECHKTLNSKELTVKTMLPWYWNNEICIISTLVDFKTWLYQARSKMQAEINVIYQYLRLECGKIEQISGRARISPNVALPHLWKYGVWLVDPLGDCANIQKSPIGPRSVTDPGEHLKNELFRSGKW